jgi:hypothetical protein
MERKKVESGKPIRVLNRRTEGASYIESATICTRDLEETSEGSGWGLGREGI